VVQKIGLCPGSALNLNQAKPAPKQLNFLKLGDAGGFIFNGYLTQTEPIFESRAVYMQNLPLSFFVDQIFRQHQTFAIIRSISRVNIHVQGYQTK